MAECLAARLAAQEEQIRLLAGEISSLRDGLSRGSLDAGGAAAVITPELETLKTENDKLKYRLLHLRRGLQAELQLEEEAKKAKGGRQNGVKCGRAPEGNTSKQQQTNNRADKKVKAIVVNTGPGQPA